MSTSGPLLSQRLTRPLLFLLATGAAVSVANLYYNQPLLLLIGHTFHQSASHMGLISMATQAGYAVGLFIFTPLGDVWPRRKLIIWLCLACAVSLFGLATSHTLWEVAGFSFVTGVCAVTPQILLPLTADLADDNRRGQAVGTVMSGLLLGVLAARTVSGLAATWIGWRGVYIAAGILMLALAVLMRLALPALPAKSRARYLTLVGTMWHLWRSEPLLRQSSAIGAALFGAFSVLWTVLAFRLDAPPYHMNSAAVGLFGIAGIAGVLGSPITGRLADKRGPYFMVGVGIIATLLAFVILWSVSSAIVGLIIGIFLMDFGVQTGQVSNQARIYALAPEMRSRINSVFMVCYFLGGAIGSAVGSTAYDHFGWTGACATAVFLIACALTVHLLRRPAPRTRELEQSV
ncbi:MAG: MFS transporter [Firmicutes bacterium]|nr:MFS transporter [Bacillota bacterium]